ncbi:MAG TPA: hypothetical protein VFI31_24025 [Pirellulales bacterium]|nr:hypothetical protein [Pirellulales bacterium]
MHVPNPQGQSVEVANSAGARQEEACQPTSRGQLWMRFLLGTGWLAMIAAGLMALSGYPPSGWPFLAMYAATVCGALFIAGLALAWLVSWAKNKRARTGQFAVSSLFFLTTFAAMYFAGIRWVVGCIEAHVHQALPWNAVALVGLGYTLVVFVTLPAVVGITEPLLWFGVWLVRWQPARPFWKLLLRRWR